MENVASLTLNLFLILCLCTALPRKQVEAELFPKHAHKSHVQHGKQQHQLMFDVYKVPPETNSHRN